MNSLNSVHLLGTVSSKDIKLRSDTNKKPVTSFKLKVSRDFRKNVNASEGYDRITVVCWNKLAELAVSSLKEGMLIFVTGSIHTDTRVLDSKYEIKNEDGSVITDFHVPVFEINAEHIYPISSLK